MIISMRRMARALAFALAALALAGTAAGTAAAQARRTAAQPEAYSPDELVNSGHRFFGNITRGLALTIEEATRRWGQPNGYILGQEGGAAFVGGLRYGEGVLYTRNAGDRRVFWQGPSFGFDFGGQGAGR